MKHRLLGAATAVAATLAFAAAFAQDDLLVTKGSPGSPFSQNKRVKGDVPGRAERLGLPVAAKGRRAR